MEEKSREEIREEIMKEFDTMTLEEKVNQIIPAITKLFELENEVREAINQQTMTILYLSAIISNLDCLTDEDKTPPGMNLNMN